MFLSLRGHGLELLLVGEKHQQGLKFAPTVSFNTMLKNDSDDEEIAAIAAGYLVAA